MSDSVTKAPLALLAAFAFWPVAAPTLGAQLAQAPAPASRPVPVGRAVRAPLAPVVDGRLDDPAWAAAPVLADFVQHEPYDGQPATERTEVRIVYDDAAVYIGAWLFDRDPSGMVRSEARRDINLQETDAFQIVWDTYRDRQNAFVFGTTPAGIEYDGQVTKEGEGGFTGNLRQQGGSGGGVNLNWDGSWEVATSADEHGWYAEFRIPFTTLRYGRGGPQVWGMNLARNLRRRNEQSYWTPIPRQYTLYRVSQAGTLEGLEAPTRITAQVTPYAIGTAHRDFVLDSALDWSGNGGGDAKVGLTPSLTLDLTYHTDFAQVEVDEQQVNLTRFNLFFPEKRPFFLENAGTFSVGTPQAVELFFSRRVGIGPNGEQVPIRGGGRLSGKVGALQVGLLDIRTEAVGTAIPENNYAVGRLVRELPNRSRIGVTFGSRHNTDSTADRNLTYAVDGRLGIGDRIAFDGYLAGTDTPNRVAGRHAYSLSGSYTGRNWEAGAVFREVGEDFSPELGFLERPAHRFVSLRVLRHLRTPNVPWFREFRPHISYREHFDLAGFSQTRLIHIDSHFVFANGAFFQLPAINLTREGLQSPFEISPGVMVPSGTYDNLEWGFQFNTNRGAPLSIESRIDIGGFYSGYRKGAQGTVNARAGATFNAALRYSYYEVDLREGSFETSLLGLRLSYTFTPRIYLQSLVQYNNQSEQFSGNVRFGWLSTAGTGLFLVYNDVQRVQRVVPGTLLGTWDAQDRAFIVKLTRQFNLVR